MLIVVLGDIHDRVRNLEKVLADVANHDVRVMICTGDINTPETLTYLARGFDGEIHVAWGNNDVENDLKATIDRERLLKVYYHGLIGRLTLEKKHLAFTHKPKEAESLLAENRFDLVCYGHTHEARIERVETGTLPSQGKAWLVNPGDIQGRFGRAPSYVLYDTATDEPTLHEVSD